MTEVKNDCPLFQQRKINYNLKTKNLKFLMEKHELDLRALATMSDKSAAEDNICMTLIKKYFLKKLSETEADIYSYA